MQEDLKWELILIVLYVLNFIYTQSQHKIIQTKKIELAEQDNFIMSYELKVISQVEMSKNLIVFEFISFFFIIVFGNELIKYEFSEQDVSKSRNLKFFDDYSIMIYHVYILIHLIIDLIVFNMLEQFKKIQRQIKFNFIILFVFIEFMLNLDRYQSHKYFSHIHLLYLLNNVVIFYQIIQILLTNYNMLRAKKLTQSIKDITLNNLYDSFYAQLMDLDQDELMNRNQDILDLYNVILSIRKIRTNYKQILEKSFQTLVMALVPIIILAIFIISKEFKYDLKGGVSFYNTEELNILKQKNIYDDYYFIDKLKPVSNIDSLLRPNVILMLLNGLDNKQIEGNEQYYKFIEQIQSEQNGLDLKIRSEYPVKAVNNWFSMFTGVESQVHGVWSNSKNQVFADYDNIFSHIQENNDYLQEHMVGNQFFQTVMSNAFTSLQNSVQQLIEFNDENIYYSFYKKYTKYQQQQNRTKKNKGNQDDIHMKLNISQEIQTIINSSLVLDEKLSLIEELKQQIDNQQLIQKNIIKHHFYLVQLSSQQIDKYLVLIKHIYKQMDNNTILLITSDDYHNSDHYNFDDSEQPHFPLLFIFKNNKIKSKQQNAYQMKDLASTLSQLLGLPVPRMNSGKVIEEIVKEVIDKEDQLNFTQQDFQIQQYKLNQFNVIKNRNKSEQTSHYMNLISYLFLVIYGILVLFILRIYNNFRFIFSIRNLFINLKLFILSISIYGFIVCCNLGSLYIVYLYEFGLTDITVSIINQPFKISFYFIFFIGLSVVFGVLLNKIQIMLYCTNLNPLTCLFSNIDSLEYNEYSGYQIVTMKYFTISLNLIIEIALILIYLQNIQDNEINTRFKTINLLFLNTIYMIMIGLELFRVPEISPNNNNYDYLYISTYIDFNNMQELGLLNSQFGKMDISQLDKLITQNNNYQSDELSDLKNMSMQIDQPIESVQDNIKQD